MSDRQAEMRIKTNVSEQGKRERGLCIIIIGIISRAMGGDDRARRHGIERKEERAKD